MTMGIGGGLSLKRNDKQKEKEKKRKSKLFNLNDLLSNDCDNIKGQKKSGQNMMRIGSNEDKEFEDFLKQAQMAKKRFKSGQSIKLTKIVEEQDET